MGILDGKVAIVTGSGGGIGREHALALSAAGAALVINDLGGTRDGSGAGHNMADAVVEEIRKAGGTAVANYDSVATVAGGQGILKAALDAFGRIDVLVNNAGILRDKTLAKMEEGEWDIVISVHLKGTYCVTRPVFQHMKEQSGGGSIINTSSTSGLEGNFGQTNYGAAKAGIAGFTRTGRPEIRHPRERDRAGGADAHDRGPAARAERSLQGAHASAADRAADRLPRERPREGRDQEDLLRGRWPDLRDAHGPHPGRDQERRRLDARRDRGTDRHDPRVTSR
jgi:NAD(P)-dependent dehydrogenase (short-subunit alcohol dehydrogenase family)